MDIKKNEEQGKLILEMQKAFSTDDIFLFFIKVAPVGLFWFIIFSIGCYAFHKIEGYIIYFLTYYMLMIVYLIKLLKIYYINKIEFEPTYRIINIYTHYPLLKIKCKQEFQIKDVKIKKAQFNIAKIDAIVIISSDNQITKFPIFAYKYTLKKENVNNFIAKINKYL